MKLTKILYLVVIALLTQICAYAKVNETELLAAVIIAEAGGEGTQGMVAVANVINNRKIYNSLSIKQILLKKYQFSCLNHITINKKETLNDFISRQKGHKKYNEAYKIALRVMRGSLKDITGGADHYYANYIREPYWTKSMRKTAQIGQHIFFASR